MQHMNPSDRFIRSANSSTKRRGAKDEKGSSLIFALVFMIVTSLVVLSLAGMAKNDLINTTNFKSAQSFQSTANSATEVALDSIRYHFTPATLNASPPQPCWTTSPTESQLTLNGQSMAVWCSTRWAPVSQNTRVVTFVSCPSSLTAQSCASTPTLEAVVTFDDYPLPRGAVSTVECTTTCGVGMSINSWVFDPKPPQLTSVTPTTGSSSGGTTVTLAGSRFTPGSTVSFVSTNLSGNVVLSATNVTVISSTSLTATTPSLSSGASYYVTVTTPVGTSAYGPTFN